MRELQERGREMEREMKELRRQHEEECSGRAREVAQLQCTIKKLEKEMHESKVRLFLYLLYRNC